MISNHYIIYIYKIKKYYILILHQSIHILSDINFKQQLSSEFLHLFWLTSKTKSVSIGHDGSQVSHF